MWLLPSSPQNRESSEGVGTSGQAHRPKALVGHDTGVPWRTRTRLTVTVDLLSGLPEVCVAGILLLNERGFL